MRKRAAFLIALVVLLSVSCGKSDTASQENDPAITSEEEAVDQDAETAEKEPAENASANENAASPDTAQSSAESADDAAGTDDADGSGAAEESAAAEVSTVKDTPEPEPEKEVVPYEWTAGTPEDAGLNDAFMESRHAAMEEIGTMSSLIVRHGVIADEYYADGYDEKTVFPVHSASKTITGALTGIAIDEGLLEGVDVPVAPFFPEMEESGRYEGLTVGHLLTNTSGIASTESRWYEWQSSPDWLQYLFELPIEAAPGQTFHYSTGNTHLLSAILEQVTGERLFDYAKEKIFDPVGLVSVRLHTDPQGIGDGWNGFSMTARDMALFGQRLLNKGSVNWEKVIPAEWVEEMSSVQVARGGAGTDYGYQTWVHTFAGHDGFYAYGFGNQYIFVIPDLELVITFTAPDMDENRFGVYRQLVNDIVSSCG